MLCQTSAARPTRPPIAVKISEGLHANACLTRIRELPSPARVLILDADFRLYRRNGRQTIPLIYPAP